MMDKFLARIGFKPYPDYEAKYNAMLETNVLLQQRLNTKATLARQLRTTVRVQAGVIRDLKVQLYNLKDTGVSSKLDEAVRKWTHPGEEK